MKIFGKLRITHEHLFLADVTMRTAVCVNSQTSTRNHTHQ